MARRDAIRRWGSAAVMMLALYLAIRTLAPPPPATVRVAIATGQLRAGAQLSENDVTVATMPTQWAPADRVETSDAVGRSLAGPISAGEVITATRLMPKQWQLASGEGVAWVPVVDPAEDSQAVPGRRVDLYRPGLDSPVVTGLRVLPSGGPGRQEAADFLGSSSSSDSQRILVAVSTQQAGALARAVGGDMSSAFLMVVRP